MKRFRLAAARSWRRSRGQACSLQAFDKACAQWRK